MNHLVGDHSSAAGSTVLNVLLVLVIIAALLAVLLPIFTEPLHRPTGSYCQSNLKQIGSAIRMYVSDWQDTYPTNRPYSKGRKLGPVAAYVRVTDFEAKDVRNRYGVSWVEGLYNYIEQSTRYGDPSIVWKCPSASQATYPSRSKTAMTTYVLNRNLIEKPERIIRSAASLLMAREMDRTLNAELRPMNDSTWTSRQAPVSPFLTEFDRRIGRTDPNLHAKGSNLLLADGHVKYYDNSYYPSQKDITKANCWNPDTKQWFNYYWANPKTAEQKAKNMSIAITP